MVQEVSQRLGDIYVLLDTVQMFMAEVPDILEQKGLAEVNWAAISWDAQEVRAILAAQGIPPTSSGAVLRRRTLVHTVLADNQKQ